MKHPAMGILRDKKSSIEAFRIAADQMASTLSLETAKLLSLREVEVETPLGVAQSFVFEKEILLVPILRSGMAMLPAFLKVFTAAKVGVVGVRRDERTALPFLYYKNFPKVTGEEDVIILDPMIATGGSGALVVEILKSLKFKEEQMTYVGMIGAIDGIERLRKLAPKMKILCSEVDQELNDAKFIVPGLGDFGDRFYGTL